MLQFDVPTIETDKCATTIRNAVTGADPRARCDVDLKTKRVAVESLLPPTDLVEAMEEVGFLATLVPQVNIPTGSPKKT